MDGAPGLRGREASSEWEVPVESRAGQERGQSSGARWEQVRGLGVGEAEAWN